MIQSSCSRLCLIAPYPLRLNPTHCTGGKTSNFELLDLQYLQRVSTGCAERAWEGSCVLSCFCIPTTLTQITPLPHMYHFSPTKMKNAAYCEHLPKAQLRVLPGKDDWRAAGTNSTTKTASSLQALWSRSTACRAGATLQRLTLSIRLTFGIRATSGLYLNEHKHPTKSKSQPFKSTSVHRHKTNSGAAPSLCCATCNTEGFRLSVGVYNRPDL